MYVVSLVTGTVGCVFVVSLVTGRVGCVFAVSLVTGRVGCVYVVSLVTGTVGCVFAVTCYRESWLCVLSLVTERVGCVFCHFSRRELVVCFVTCHRESWLCALSVVTGRVGCVFVVSRFTGKELLVYLLFHLLQINCENVLLRKPFGKVKARRLHLIAITSRLVASFAQLSLARASCVVIRETFTRHGTRWI